MTDSKEIPPGAIDATNHVLLRLSCYSEPDNNMYWLLPVETFLKDVKPLADKFRPNAKNLFTYFANAPWHGENSNPPISEQDHIAVLFFEWLTSNKAKIFAEFNNPMFMNPYIFIQGETDEQAFA